MANVNSNKLIRIYGVTLPEKGYRTRGYGHGTTRVKETKNWYGYVDYFIEDLVDLIINQDLEDKFLKRIKEKKEDE